MAIEPHLFRRSNNTKQMHIRQTFFGYLSANRIGIRRRCVAGYIQLILRQIAHHIEQHMKIFLLLHLADGEQKRAFGIHLCRDTIRLQIDTFDAIVHHIDRCAVQMHKLFGFVFGKL